MLNKYICNDYYEHWYKYRPEEEDLKQNDIIRIRTHFPKTIKKDTYIISAFPVVSYDAMKEFYILYFVLHKPLVVCATTGHWEGTPFLLITTDDFTITLEDEKIIQQYKSKIGFKTVE